MQILGVRIFLKEDFIVWRKKYIKIQYNKFNLKPNQLLGTLSSCSAYGKGVNNMHKYNN